MFGAQQPNSDSTQIKPHLGDDPVSHGLCITDIDLKTGIPNEIILIEPVSFMILFKINKRLEDDTYWIQKLSSTVIFLNEEELESGEKRPVRGGDVIKFRLSTSEEYEWQFFPTLDLGTNFQQRGNPKAEDTLRDEVLCSLCLKCMHRPTTLSPCLHSFCSSCLSRHLLDFEVCPLCREKITSVRKNFLLNKLTSHVLKSNPDLKISNDEADFSDKNDSLFDGADIRRYEDGSFYYGFFKNKKREGYGKFTGADRSVYYGNWQDDKKEGFGESSWIDGRVYNGEWKGGLRHGVGEMVWPDGARYYGFWQKNVFHGSGVFIWPNGRQLAGQWKDGVYDSPYC